jgi:hypothetical protein
LQLLHFFSQNMKLLAYCFVLMHAFKLTKIKMVNRLLFPYMLLKQVFYYKYIGI